MISWDRKTWIEKPGSKCQLKTMQCCSIVLIVLLAKLKWFSIHEFYQPQEIFQIFQPASWRKLCRLMKISMPPMNWSIIFGHAYLDKKIYLILENRWKCSLIALLRTVISIKANSEGKLKLWVSKIIFMWNRLSFFVIYILRREIFWS